MDVEKIEKLYSVACGGVDLQVRKIGSLKKTLEYLPLPKNGYSYDKNMLADLLSLRKITSKFRVVMDANINNAIYVYGEDEDRYEQTSKVQ